MTVLFTSTYCYIYLSVKAIIKFVITVELKDVSTRQFLITMFGFVTIKLLYELNITIRVSINSVTIPQRYISNLLCDNFSLTSVTFLGFYFMILCCLNNYLLVFSLMLSLIKTNKKKILTLYLLLLPLCSIFRHKWDVQTQILAENNISHVHITLH